MGVDIQTYRTRIGAFSVSSCQPLTTVFVYVNFSHALKTLGAVLFIGILLLMSGVEPNPGPTPGDDGKQTSAGQDLSDTASSQDLQNKLHQKFKEYGLDGQFWSGIFREKLGINSLEQLKYVGASSFAMLKKSVRYEWEENALRSLLSISDEGYTNYRQTQKNDIQQRQENVTQILNNLEKLRKEQRDRTDSLVKTEEEKLRRILNIPDDAWINQSKNKSLDAVIDNIKTQFGDLKEIVSRGNELSPKEVIENASGGLILRGVLLTRNVNDCLELRKSVIKAPENVKLRSPIIQQKDQTIEISSRHKSDTFHRCLDTMGYSTSASVQGSGWGFSAEAGFSTEHSEEHESEMQVNTEQTFHSRVMYSIIPAASCELVQESIHLSKEALQELQKIELIKSSTNDNRLVQNKFEEFFKEYGSHVNTGTVHFGGIYEWVATYSSEFSSVKSSMKAMVHDALSAFVSMGYSGVGFGVGGSVSADYVKGHANFSGSYEESELSKTNLRVVKLGGPQEVSSLPLWKLGLMSYNNTWSVIDRGTVNSKDFKGIWELLINCKSAFSDPIRFSETMRCSWEKMTGMSAVGQSKGELIVKNVESIDHLLSQVTEWKDDPNLAGSCIEFLTELSDKVNKLIECTGNQNFWVDQIQTKPVITGFLLKITNLKSSFNEQDSSLIRYLIRRLITPAENKSFPHKDIIQSWVTPSTSSDNLTSALTAESFTSTSDLITALKTKFLPPLQISEANKGKTSLQQQDIDTHITVELAIAARRLVNYFEKKYKALDSGFLVALLLPLTYNHETFGFDQLVTTAKLEQFLKAAERHIGEYQLYSSKGHLQTQAFIVELTIKNIQSNTDVYQSEHTFSRVINLLRSNLLPQLNEVLNKYATTSPFDFSSMKTCLEQLRQGNKNFSLTKTVPLKGLKDALSERSLDNTKTVKATVPVQTNKANDILKQLGLEKLFPGKITIQDVMSVRREKERSKIEMTDLPWIVLRKVIMIDFRAREIDIAAYFSRTNPDEKTEFEAGDVGSFDDILGSLESAASNSDESINPLDVFLVLFCCCDHMLKQVLVNKMFMCKLAIPFIYPFMSPENLVCSLWPLRTIYIESVDIQQQTTEISVVEHPSKRVTFMRLGRPSWSKSKLMNDILSNQTHDTFFNKDCSLGLSDRHLSNGLVEASWFIPSGKDSDVMPEVITFLNLRGNAEEFSNQVNFLQTLSHILVVMMNEEYLRQDSCISFMKSIHQSKVPLVLFLTNQNMEVDPRMTMASLKMYAEKIGDSIKGTKFITTMKNGKQRNAADVKHDIRQTISHMLKDRAGEPIEKFCHDIKVTSICCDEENSKCIAGKLFSQKLLNHFSEGSLVNTKEKMTPLQGNLWLTWSNLQKEMNKAGQKHTIYGQDQLQKKMILVREQQLDICNNLSPVMADFISFLITNIDDQEVITYSMQWLKLRLDQNSRTILPGLIKQYHENWTAFKAAKDKQRFADIQKLKNVVDASEKELADASFGFEHLIRELGQIYEAVVADGRSKVSNDVRAKVEILPEIVAKLLKLGIPLEIMDGDAANVPLTWVRAVLTSLKSLIGDKKLLSLSVLGIQSSGKSTLLNTMFGLQFAVSAGRCTRGVFVQLVQAKSGNDYPFDYILVIDTEGLRAPELGLQKFDHDNELATLVIGMGDITIMNVKGENTAEVKDVLQIAVHAFLRLKLVNQRLNLSQSCVFIHQNVPAVNAREKMLHGRQKLVENLDSMTLEAATQEQITDICAFDQVIDFNSQEHVWYFSDLWHGDPPMAPANPGYSEKVLEVKRCILDDVGSKKNTFLTIANTVQHIEDLWKGIIADDFVFSFRNSLEVQAYNIMESKYQELAWSLEQFTLKWVRKTAAIELGKCTNVDDLEGCTLRLITLLSRDIGGEREKLKQDLDTFFDSHNLKDILIKWKQNKINSLVAHSEDLINRTKQEILEMKERERIDLLRRTKQTELEREINNKARQLADNMKGKHPTEREIKDLFNEMYIHWINQLATRVTSDNTPIDIEVEIILYGRLYKESAYLNNEIDINPLKRPLGIHLLEGSLNPDDITEQHISISKNFFRVKKKSWEKCVYQAIEVANTAMRNIDVYLTNLSVTDSKFNKSFVSEILNIVIGEIDKHNTHKAESMHFTLLPPFKAKLVVHVCRYAVQVFKSMNDSFDKKHSTKAKLENYRSTAWNLFRNVVDQKTEEVIAASFFTDSMFELIKGSIKVDLPIRVEDEILSNFSHTKYHLILDIMDDLARKGSFTLFRKYISDPHTYAFKWLTTFTNDRIFGRNSNGQTRYAEMARSKLTKLISCVQKSVTGATSSVNGNMGLNIKKWISVFEEKVREEINIQSGTLSHVGDIAVYDFPNFQRLILNRLDELEEKIKQVYDSETSLSVTWEGKTPYQNVMDKIWGCTAQCPFCHEPCQNTSKDHVATGESHTCIQHRPSGIGGERWDEPHRKDQLCVESCNYSVQWKGVRFNCRDCGYECRKSGRCDAVGDNLQYHNVIEYKTVLPDWDIAPSADMYSKSEYWMWFMATYRHQLKDMYSAQLPDVPDSWVSITSESARNSLRRSAN